MRKVLLAILLEDDPYKCMVRVRSIAAGCGTIIEVEEIVTVCLFQPARDVIPDPVRWQSRALLIG